MSMSSFADLGVSRPVVDALTRGGIRDPFPIQRLVIGRALRAQASTEPLDQRMREPE